MAARPGLARGFLVAVALYAVLISIPQPPVPRGRGLDASWSLGLNMAHAQRLVPGRDFIFSYGPLGYLADPEPASGAPAWALAYRLGLYLIWVFVLLRIAVVFASKLAALWTILILPMGVALDLLAHEYQLVITVIAVLLLTLAGRTKWRYLELAVAGFLAGIASLVKFSDGIEAAALFLLVAAVLVHRDWPLTRDIRRQAFCGIAVLPVSLVTLFFLSTGSIAAIWPYLQTSWQLASGYSDAMGMAGPLWQAVVDLALVGLFLGLPLVAGDLRFLWPGYLAAGVATFFSFRHALVRQDFPHAEPFYARLAVAILFLLVCAERARDRRIIVLLQCLSLVTGLAVVVDKYPEFRNVFESRLLVRWPYTANFDAYLHWPVTWRNVGETNARERAQIRRDQRFDKIIGRHTVTVIPWDIDRAKAENWNWKPSPMLQFYSAYTPLLDTINAAQIDSASTADFAVAELSDIDGRHPFLSEPLSWRALVDRYDLETENEEAILLRRRDGPRFGSPLPVGSQVAGWDQEITLPQADGFLLMAPQFRKSIRGLLASAAFRAARVYVDVRLSSGKVARWLTVPRNMAAGVQMDPFPQSQEEFRSVFQSGAWRLPHDKIVSLRFHTDQPSEYQTSFRLLWSRLPTRAPDQSVEPFVPTTKE